MWPRHLVRRFHYPPDLMAIVVIVTTGLPLLITVFEPVIIRCRYPSILIVESMMMIINGVPDNDDDGDGDDDDDDDDNQWRA